MNDKTLTELLAEYTKREGYSNTDNETFSRKNIVEFAIIYWNNRKYEYEKNIERLKEQIIDLQNKNLEKMYEKAKLESLLATCELIDESLQRGIYPLYHFAKMRQFVKENKTM